MFKKIKFFSALFVTAMYIVGFLFAFSGDLIQQIQTVRHRNQINQINQAETFSLSITKWNELAEKQEIKVNNIYYDVVSHSIVGQKVFIKAVKDNFENEIRVVFSQVFNKNKHQNSDKKKRNFFSNQLVVESQSIWNIKNFLDFISNMNFKLNFNLKTNSFIFLPQKPPCISFFK